MPRYLLKISYCGTGYCGWQVQPNGTSVQGKICDALEKFLNEKTSATGCSRTDSGVHAKEFYLHFDTERDLKNVNVPDGVNFYLPEDIRAISCKKVSDDFHARYSAKGKTYVYRIYNNRIFSPFEVGFAYHEKRMLDVEKMKTAAKSFVGEYNFSAFCSAGSSVTDKVRNITFCNVEKLGDIVEITVTANGFLYNMVRIIAGTLIEVGRGSIPDNSVKSIILSENRDNAGMTAPPEGLYLTKVFYEVE